MRAPFLGILAFASALAVASLPRAALAQSAPSIDTRSWRASTDPQAGLALEPVATPGAWNWNAAGYLSYAHHPLTLRNAAGDVVYRPISAQLGSDLVGSVGIGSRWAIGLSLPTAQYQTGTSGMPATVAPTGEAPSFAIGDLGVHGKGVLIDDSQGGFGLAGLATVTLPTGDTQSFMGEGAVTASARLLAEYTLVVASLNATLGYTVRTSQRTWPDASVGGVTFGDSIPWSFGMSLRPSVFNALEAIDSGHRQRWDLAVRGSLPAGPVGPFGTGNPGSSALSPVMLSLSDRVELGHYRDAYLVVGTEFGMTEAVGVPIFRGVLGVGWAPRSHDVDGDGVLDDVDQCPEIPEDKDGFEDGDGCPDIDNDDDGVLDRDDACPIVAGVESTDPKKNGCPAADQDGDGVPDDVDACPAKRGPANDVASKNGCPLAGDRDHDGVPDDADRCPDQAEDKDGLADDDGCPDPDDDGDGVRDAEDACPREPGEASSDPRTNGCPNPDRDGDSFDNTTDKCPDEPETFNGVKDDDGCKDDGGAAIVSEGKTSKANGDRPKIAVRAGQKLTADSAAARAIVAALNAHRDWTVLVAVRAGGKADADLAKAGELAAWLDGRAHREVAEAIAWGEVKNEPETTPGVKIVIVVGGKKTAGETPLAPVAPKP